jgi:hypothetical protein
MGTILVFGSHGNHRWFANRPFDFLLRFFV